MTSSGERTTADDLTAEQIEHIIANHESGASSARCRCTGSFWGAWSGRRS